MTPLLSMIVRNSPAAASGLSSFGVFDEILQAPVGRDPELLDWIADVSAAIVAVTCFTILRVVLSRTSAKPAIEPAPTE